LFSIYLLWARTQFRRSVRVVERNHFHSMKDTCRHSFGDNAMLLLLSSSNRYRYKARSQKTRKWIKHRGTLATIAQTYTALQRYKELFISFSVYIN